MYDVTPLVEATGGLERAVAGDLAQASAGGADITVDLAALYSYYSELATLDAEISRQLEQLTGLDAAGTGGYCGAPDGVRLGFEATYDAKVGSASLASSLRALQADLRAHLESLRDNYNGYIAQETQNVDRLNGATAWADKPLGW